MKKGIVIILLICLILMNGCEKKAMVDPIDDNYRVFYQIFVGSFSDSNNDGIGDLRGIINRLDYLNDGNIYSNKSLGIQGIWLSPIFTSPSYHKYDVADYFSIDPKFGTMDDLNELLDLCHQRNIKVILDLPINHTSSQNEWFHLFKNARINNYYDNDYFDYYTCKDYDTLEKNHTYYSIYGSDGLYYEGNFSSDMPELNFDNIDVRNKVVEIAKYWLDKGVDGFRFDAAKYIYFNDNKQTIDFWKWYLEQLKNINPDIYTVAEVWSSDNEANQYVEAVNCFNFTMAQAEGVIATAAKGGNINTFTNYVCRYNDTIAKINPDSMMISFIANHDMDRASGYLNVANGRAYIGANLYLLAPGSPFIYYGEEIGLKGTRGSENTDANRRLAMLWGDDDTIKDPIGSSFGKNKQVNGTVSDQLKDKNSLYNYYCKLIGIRNKYPQIARGHYEKLQLNSTNVGGFIVEYNGEKTYIIHNVSTEEITIDLSNDLSISQLLDYIGLGKATLKTGQLSLSGQTSVILQ